MGFLLNFLLPLWLCNERQSVSQFIDVGTLTANLICLVQPLKNGTTRDAHRCSNVNVNSRPISQLKLLWNAGCLLNRCCNPALYLVFPVAHFDEEPNIRQHFNSIPEALISPLVWFRRGALMLQSCSDLVLHIVSCKSG